MRSTAARQQYICATVAIGGLLFGFDTAVISGAIQPVKIQFALDTAMEGWLVSSGLVGCILGVLATGLLSDRIGRKKNHCTGRIDVSAVCHWLCFCTFSVNIDIQPYAGRNRRRYGFGHFAYVHY